MIVIHLILLLIISITSRITNPFRKYFQQIKKLNIIYTIKIFAFTYTQNLSKTYRLQFLTNIYLNNNLNCLVVFYKDAL